MSVKLAAAGMALVLVLAISAPRALAARQTWCPGNTSIDLTNFSHLLMAQEAPGASDQPCRDEECRARQDLFCAADAFSHRLTPNTMGYRSPHEAQQEFDRYGRNIQALEQSSPGRIRLYCKLLADVAPTLIDDPIPEDGALDWTGAIVVDWAIRLDRPGNHCLATVAAAMPQTKGKPGYKDGLSARGCLRKIRTCQRELDDPPMLVAR